MSHNEQEGLEIEGVVHNTMDESVGGVKTFTDPPIVPDEAYDATAWNANMEPPTKNAVRDKIETLATDSLVMHLAGAENVTGVKTFTVDPIVPDEVYDVTAWNGNMEPPTKNAVRDEIESVKSTISGFANDSDVVHTTGAENVAGVKTFADDPIIPDEAYDATAWNNKLEPPTKNAVRDKIETLAVDSLVVHLSGAENITGVKTFTVDPIVPDEAYDATAWNGNMEPPTKNAIRDVFVTLATDSLVMHLAGAENVTGVKTFTVDPIVPDEAYDATNWNNSMEPPTKNAIRDLAVTLAVDSMVAHLAGAENITGVKTFTVDPIVPDEAYDATNWNGNFEPPTKNAVRDEIESVKGSISGLAADADVVHLTGAEAVAGVKTFTDPPLVPNEAYDPAWSGSLEPPTKDAIYNKLEAMLAAMPEAQYFAVIDQTGTSAPTEEEEHSNTLVGGTPTFGRPSGAGTYTITSLNSFPVGRTNIQVSNSGKHASIDYVHTSASVITVTVKGKSDDVSLIDLGGKFSIAVQVFKA